MALTIKEPHPHSLMPQASHDEHAREDITASIKHFLTENVYPYDQLVYEKRACPTFVKTEGREPGDCGEVHRLMMEQPYTRMWSAMARSLQEMLWDNAGAIVERQHERLKAEAQNVTDEPVGSLTLDPDFETPRYISAVDIHAMPGGYGADQGDDDLFNAAVYDRGAYYYTLGRVGRQAEGAGSALVRAVKQFFPALKPKRILDIGCAAGWSTTTLAAGFPDAEVHGIDVGAAFMRYAHARAEALGRAAHFHQMSGERLKFPDGHFDLVTTGAVFHETSKQAAPNIMAEIHRVLRSGGVSMNYDIPCAGDFDLHGQFMLNWDCYFNGEPFWREWTSWDRREFMAGAGFEPDSVVQAFADRDRDGHFKLFPSQFDDVHPSARGGIGRVQFFGAPR